MHTADIPAPCSFSGHIYLGKFEEDSLNQTAGIEIQEDFLKLMTFELSFDGQLKVEEGISSRGTAYVVTKEGNNRIYRGNYMYVWSRNLAL